jgi:uncharacterized protein (TIGR03118 family)
MPNFFRLRQIRRTKPLHRYVPSLEGLEERDLLSAGYVATGLLSDIPGLTAFTDPHLTNPWGIAAGPTSPFWFSDTGSSVTTMADGSGNPNFFGPALVVSIPGPNGIAAPAMPTGTVANTGSGFDITANGRTGPSLFLFATQQGTIAGWNPHVDLTQAVTAVDNSSTPGIGPIYTGLTIAANSQGTFLYAANFRSGQIDVFDDNFHAVHLSSAFTDPNLPAGFVPFNVQNLNGSLYVTYTKEQGGRYDATLAPGIGIVDVYSTDGQLLRRLTTGGPLDAPWGLAVAPDDFGAFSGDVLVGNFGDGRINAFDPSTGSFLGSLADSHGVPLSLPGLWGLSFGNDALAGSTSVLYFTAGIGNEHHGLFGVIEPAGSNTLAGSSQGLTAALARITASSPPSNYPLPPSNGPDLGATVAAQAEVQVEVLPIQPSSLGLIPTLLAANAANYGATAQAGANVAATPLGSGSVSNTLPFATAAPTTMTPAAVPSRLALMPGSILHELETTSPEERDRVVALLTDTVMASYVVEPGVGDRLPRQFWDAAYEASEESHQSSRTAAVASQTDQAPHAAAFGATALPLQSEEATVSRFFKALHYVVIAVLLVCLVPWYRRRPRRDGGFMQRLSLRSTKRSMKTLPMPAEQRPRPDSTPTRRLSASEQPLLGMNVDLV